MFDEHRRETLLMFDLHAVEDAAVGIDADEELLGRFESRAKTCAGSLIEFRQKSRRLIQPRVKPDLLRACF